MITFEPPRLPDESRELYRFLYDLTEKLNLMAEQTSAEAMWTTTLKALNSPLTGDTLASSESATSNDQLGAIRQLIIGSADVMFKVADTESLSLSGLYVAKSEFGTYFENATVTINGTPWGIEQLYNYSADIDSIYGAYKQDTEAYIKTGLLYYNGVTPVYGVGVGELYNGTAEYGETEDVTFDPSKTYYEKLIDDSFAEYTGDRSGNPSSLGLWETTIYRSTTGHYATFTANDMKFWDGGMELASISASGLNFPNAYIIGGDIKIGTPSNGEYPFHVATNGNLTIGFYDNTLDGDYPFIVDNTGALKATGATITGTLKAQTGSQIGNFYFENDAIRSQYMTGLNTGYGVYVGTAGVGVQNSAGTNFAYLKASDGTLHASGATISGAITATRLNVSSATTGTLDCTQLTVSHLDASAISTGTFDVDRVRLYGEMTVYDAQTGSGIGGYLGYEASQIGAAGIGLESKTRKGKVGALDTGAWIKYTHTYGGISQCAALPGMLYLTSCGQESYTSQTYALYFAGKTSSTPATFYPGTNQTHDLGKSTAQWNNTYCTNSAWAGSDRKMKEDIEYDVDAYLNVWDKLKPVSYRFKNGTSGRTHFGFIAQDVEQAILDSGMTTQDYACIAKYEEEDGGYGYSLRYEEFIALNTLKIKKLEARIAALEGAN